MTQSIDASPARRGAEVPRIKAKAKSEGKIYPDTTIQVDCACGRTMEVTIQGVVASVSTDFVGKEEG